MKPAYSERIQWSPNFNPRNISGIDFGAIHTQQGKGSAASLANYLCNPSSQVSYHYVVDNDRNVVDVVDTDDSSWSVGNANARVVNVCFAGSFAEWTRQQWLDNMGNGIEIAAYLQVLDAVKYGFDPVVRGWDDLRAGKTGLTDHRGINMGVLRTPGHTDCGDYFPWDVYVAHVNRFVAELRAPTPPADTRTAIELCRAANDWLGVKTIPQKEIATPDGLGRWAAYEHGYIYWSPDSKAWAIPTLLFPKFGELGWEAGVLGYPVANQLVLDSYTKTDGTVVDAGAVQAFQHGTLYARAGADVVAVRGGIRDLFRKVGYEHVLGWPVEDEHPWGTPEYGGAVQVFQRGSIIWMWDGTSVAVDSTLHPVGLGPTKYVPTPDERALTPKDGMTGGISFFANHNDASTKGRTMGVTGEPADNPADQWFCAMRFGYVGVRANPDNAAWVKPVDLVGVSTAEKLRLKAYLPGRRLQVTNPANGKRIVVRPADWGPGVPARVIDVSETAINALGAVTDTQVVVEWVDPATRLGPQN